MLLAFSTMLGWAQARAAAPDAALAWGLFTVTLLLGAFVVITAWRTPERHLRWDRQCWHLGWEQDPADPPVRGDLHVAVDLDAWMLLHFRPEGKRLGVWIALSRRDLPDDWHALRCAVYSPRPQTSPGTGSAAPSDTKPPSA
ncbi:MAG TPA: hypothetical protein VFV25_09745 [Methylibium sp.]